MSSEQGNPTEIIIPEKDECEQTKYYCEENIWQLAKHVLDTNKTTRDLKCYVIILSNPSKFVNLWKQDISIPESSSFDQSVDDGLVFWDYHVFFITEFQDKTLVFDYNTTLPFPVEFSQYNSESIKHDIERRRYFKVIEAETYVRTFSSDRRHMRTSDGGWMKPPPPYEPILNEEKEHNLEALINMEDASDDFGEVLTTEEFIARFTQSSE